MPASSTTAPGDGDGDEGRHRGDGAAVRRSCAVVGSARRRGTVRQRRRGRAERGRQNRSATSATVENRAAEMDRCDAAWQPERDRAGGHRAAEHRADRPGGMEGVDEGPPVASLDLEPVGVLRDVGDGVHRSGHEQGGDEHRQDGGRPGDQDDHAGGDRAGHGDGRGTEPADDRARRPGPATIAPRGRRRRRARR